MRNDSKNLEGRERTKKRIEEKNGNEYFVNKEGKRVKKREGELDKKESRYIMYGYKFYRMIVTIMFI